MPFKSILWPVREDNEISRNIKWIRKFGNRRVQVTGVKRNLHKKGQQVRSVETVEHA